MKLILIALIKAYQYLLSPWIGNQCRFSPTCSHYAIEAIQKYGSFHGTRIALQRILRCHPWHVGGHDPLP